MSVLGIELTVEMRSIFAILFTELTVEVRSIYAILFTELTVEVRSICVSPVYRTHCSDAQYLCQCVYRTRR